MFICTFCLKIYAYSWLQIHLPPFWDSWEFFVCLWVFGGGVWFVRHVPVLYGFITILGFHMSFFNCFLKTAHICFCEEQSHSDWHGSCWGPVWWYPMSHFSYLHTELWYAYHAQARTNAGLGMIGMASTFLQLKLHELLPISNFTQNLCHLASFFHLYLTVMTKIVCGCFTETQNLTPKQEGEGGREVGISGKADWAIIRADVLLILKMDNKKGMDESAGQCTHMCIFKPSKFR